MTNIIERTVEYFKDRTECFDDYFPCRRDNCKLEHHVSNWMMNQFVYLHNRMLIKEKIKINKPKYLNPFMNVVEFGDHYTVLQF